MSDSISVQVQQSSYNFANPAQRQTQVRVYIPKVGRAFYLLPASAYEVLKDAEWGDVLDEAIAYQDQQEWHGGMSVAESLTAARKAIREWLQDDANRDAMNEAWFQDRARRDPVSRSLLRDKERLLAKVSELQEQLAALTAQGEALRGRARLDASAAAAAEATHWKRLGIEDPHDGPLHHPYRLGRDLPQTDGA